MPFVTRDMCSYMKEKGLSEVQEGSDKRKIRNLPSSVDPISDCVDLEYKNVHSRSKSSNTSATSKSKMSSTSNSSSSATSKSKMSSTTNSKSSATSKSKMSSTSNSSSSATSKSKMSLGSKSSNANSNQLNKSLKAKLSTSSGLQSKKSIKQSCTNQASNETYLNSKSIPNSTRTKPNLMTGEYQDKYKQLSFDEKTVRFAVALLRSNLKRIDNLSGAINKNDAKDFKNYKVDFDRPIKPSTPGIVNEDWDDVVRASHRNKEFSDFPLCCYIFNRNKTQPDSLYCRILHALSRKHPSIIQTWALFFDEKSIYVIQEFCEMGNLCKFVDSKSTSQQINEHTSVEIAQQLFKAMDYLGDLGISHRNIQPKNVLIAHRNPARIKLAGFHKSIIYWDSKNENVILLPCVPLKSNKPEFQAPEVYGNEANEVFDPIYADIWSYGATVFFSLTGKYPYEFGKDNPEIEEEILQNIEKTGASKLCKNFLKKVLNINAEMRMKSERLPTHPWFAQNYSAK